MIRGMCLLKLLHQLRIKLDLRTIMIQRQLLGLKGCIIMLGMSMVIKALKITKQCQLMILQNP